MVHVRGCEVDSVCVRVCSYEGDIGACAGACVNAVVDAHANKVSATLFSEANHCMINTNP